MIGHQPLQPPLLSSCCCSLPPTPPSIAIHRHCRQAAALIGAVVTGVLARRRRVETQSLNDKLRLINTELRRQREAQDSILSVVGLAAAQQPLGSNAAATEAANAQAAAALEALRRQEVRRCVAGALGGLAGQEELPGLAWLLACLLWRRGPLGRRTSARCCADMGWPTPRPLLLLPMPAPTPALLGPTPCLTR